MGLWGSKQKRDINLENPDVPGQVFVSEEAITNILKSVQETNNKENLKSNNKSQQTSAKITDATPSSLKLSPELHDKRIHEYETQLVNSLENASKYVENLFRERYKTLPVCNELQKSVSQCYSDNPNATLNCLDIANKFIKCVEDERQSRLGVNLNSRNSAPKLNNA